MPITGISNEVLNGDLCPAIKHALLTADRNGIGRDKLEKIMKGVLGFSPNRDQFHQVMWVSGHETGTNGLFYAVGLVPEKFKKPKKERSSAKVVAKQSPKVTEKKYEGVDEVQIKQGNIITIIKKPGTVIIPTLIILSLVGVHLLGFI